jgi:predicted glycogen debranching enzyme
LLSGRQRGIIARMDGSLHTDATQLPGPIRVSTDTSLDELLSREWVLSNRLGAYASSSVIGCNTRRYHALLTAATAPPMGRVVALAAVVDRVNVDDQEYALATNEFAEAFSPEGYEHLARFENDVIPRWVYHLPEGILVKELLLAESANAIAIRYQWQGLDCQLRVRPLVAMRNFHHVRQAHEGQMVHHRTPGGLIVSDHALTAHDLHLISPEAELELDPQWWYQLRYRADRARGYKQNEDLYAPGDFVWDLQEGVPCVITAALDEAALIFFDSALQRRRQRLELLARSVAPAPEAVRRLAVATDAFIARRRFANSRASTTILAGFPWFADWGRDTFIALPGLLLETNRFDQARHVFTTFANAINDGLIPNRFDDEGASPHYNSIDASLWFCLAAERFMRLVDDPAFASNILLPTMHAILSRMHDGTHFGIHADSDGLLTGGDATTQLTWMDAQAAGKPVTPRHGKAVEVNALWYCAHKVMAMRCQATHPTLVDTYRQRASLLAGAFVRTFWNPRQECLFDCVASRGVSPAIRPNQLFAVALPHSPLSPAQQHSVVDCVRHHLLTPMGLRTLSPADRAYQGRYEGGPDDRDAAYHQGTVWPWLMGPFVEAYLRVEQYSPAALDQAQAWLEPITEHLFEAGLGSISEVFDGDAPQRPGGCIAQAWSVAELLRAHRLIESHRP